jgi:ppGpp synthetase/RelA/SpoT-type nucleotidyltranferase
MSKFSRAEQRHLHELVEHYRQNNTVLKTFLQILQSQIEGSGLIKPHTHTLKARLKDPDHLRDKLERKLRDAKAKRRKFGISKKNLFVKVNDLAGVRILHLHTQQAAEIDKGLKQLFEEESYRLIEGPLGLRPHKDVPIKALVE